MFRFENSDKSSLIDRIERLNWLLIFLIIILASIGFLMLYSAGGGNFRPWLFRQGIFFAAFFPLMIFIAVLDIKFWFKYAYLFYLGGIFLLILVFIFGHNAMGATRWFKVGPFAIQPSEIMKICTVFALAKYFYGIDLGNIGKFRYLILPLLIIFVPAILIFNQPDLGTAAILVMAGISVLFLAGARMWKFAGVGILALIAIPFAWSFLLYDYQKQRILTFLNPDNDPLGSGYNIIQSKIAIGSGGLAGKGYLSGTQGQLNFLPEKQTDFIFTMLAEELGFLGGVFTIGVCLAIVAICINIAVKTRHQYGRLLVMGIANIFFIHMFINISMVMGLIPVVGAPLPFVSYGGTMVATMLIGFGLILNVDLYKNSEVKE